MPANRQRRLGITSPMALMVWTFVRQGADAAIHGVFKMLQSPRAMTRSCHRSLNHSGTTSRGHMLAGLALLAAFAPGAASAQATDWPTKPVTGWGPVPAGGNTDIRARIASQKLAEVFKQGFVIENRVGAGGAIAATYAAQAAPDRYTLFLAAAPPIAGLPELA